MNICADCRNPINTCSWEREFKPVDGWAAEKTKVRLQSASLNKGSRHMDSYNVINCPLFNPPPGYKKNKKNQTGLARPVIARNIVTDEETIFSSIQKASDALGVTWKTIARYIKHGGILYGNRLRYAKE